MLIGAVEVTVDATTVRWTSGMVIDGDGSPRCYSPRGFGAPLDNLRNAGTEEHWYGILTDISGDPIIQGPDDPWPGYYISTTALSNHSKPLADPTRYVDSEVVPFISIPSQLTHIGVRMGDVVCVGYRDKTCAAVCADVGPSGEIGEGSIALALILGIPASPRTGGVKHGVNYTIFKGSSRGWPRTQSDIEAQVAELVR